MYTYIYIYIESKIHVRYWQLALSVWREYKYMILNITVHILGIWSCRVWGIRTVALVPVPGQDAQHHTHNKCKVFICSYTYYIQNETKYCVFMIYTCMPACTYRRIYVSHYFSMFALGKCASTKSVHSGHFLKGATMEEWRKVMVEMVIQMTQARDTNILQTPFPGMLDLVCCWVVVLWN